MILVNAWVGQVYDFHENPNMCLYLDIMSILKIPILLSSYAIVLDMSSAGNYTKGYVRSTTGGKRVMWDGYRWQQLCRLENCFRRDQKSHGVCLLHFREQEENKTKTNKNKKFKIDGKSSKSKVNKDRKSAPIKTKSTSTRPKRIKSSSEFHSFADDRLNIFLLSLFRFTEQGRTRIGV